MNHLSSLTPFLDEAAANLPLDVMYQKMNNFEQAYDTMVVKGKMVSDTIENNLAEKGSVNNVIICITQTDKMLNELKAEVAHDMNCEYVPEPEKQKAQEQNNDFYEQLKKI